ncbi:MAG: choice-of-anchor Q domain-containing protein [Thermodesulfobacteriota bacterium]
MRYPADDTSCPGTAGDPRLAALGNNGGPTQTMALQSGSAAIDKIPAANGCGFGITIDQRGVSRPQGVACDIGAFELQPHPLVPEVYLLLLSSD